jgi:hypothetical protein
MRAALLGGLIGILVIGAGVFFAARNRSKNQTQQSQETRLRGVSFSPKSFEATDLTDFFEQSRELNVVTWQGPWGDLSETSGAGKLIEDSAKKYGYLPIVIVHNAKPDNAGLAVPFDEKTKVDYKKRAVDFVTKYKPQYFGIGIEINRMAIKAPTDFESFVNFFPEVIQAIKEASPDTQVLTTFELETMKGLNGGLFGGRNDTSKNQWALLDKFSAADVFAFSVYPGLIYKSPADIPDNYLSEITEKTSKPIAITEMGWSSETPVAGWETSEEEQAEFVKRFFDLTKDIDYRFAIWSFLYDADAGAAFKDLGLLNSDGTKRPAWGEWATK